MQTSHCSLDLEEAYDAILQYTILGTLQQWNLSDQRHFLNILQDYYFCVPLSITLSVHYFQEDGMS
jgi:hypothetical protein